jgi:hypothetical protein
VNVIVGAVLAGTADKAFCNDNIWPQALHLAVLRPDGNRAGLRVYFFWQLGQVIFISVNYFI